jgi:hypothetical protein
MANEIVFEGHGLEQLARDCRGAARAVRREIDETLLKIGAELLASAKAIASEHSSTVAGTIRMKALPGMVVIQAGSDAVPIAALWETGNKGSRDTARVTGLWFRHPLFGNREIWVNQRRFPFLRPALDADRSRIKRLMDETYDRALVPYRLKPEGV